MYLVPQSYVIRTHLLSRMDIIVFENNYLILHILKWILRKQCEAIQKLSEGLHLKQLLVHTMRQNNTEIVGRARIQHEQLLVHEATQYTAPWSSSLRREVTCSRMSMKSHITVVVATTHANTRNAVQACSSEPNKRRR